MFWVRQYSGAKITEAEELKLPRVTLSERKYMCFPLEDLEDSRE